MVFVIPKARSCLALPLLLASLITVPSKAQSGDASAEQAIEAANEQFMEAFGQADAEAIVALYTNDAVLLAPHRDPLEGPEAVAGYLRGVIEQGLTEIDLETTQVTQHGDLAIEMGEYALFAGDRRTDQGKYLVVWKREGSTRRLHRDMMNTSMPLLNARPPEAGSEKLEISGTAASSTWSSGYAANNASDGSKSSYWSSERGDAEGAWIELLLREPKTITSMRLFTSDRASGAPLKKITLAFSNGSRQTVELRGLLGWEDVEFEAVTAESVRIIVDDQFANRSGKRDWVNIHEVMLMGY